MTITIPKKITPCPILEAIIEIRFDANPNVPSDAIFGVIYNSIKDDFPNPAEKLPISEFPENIRSSDPALKYQPHYRLKADNFTLQIGPNVVSLANVEDYSGWDIFSTRIKALFQTISKLGIFDHIDRLGLRYVNFFDKFDIYQNTNLEISRNKELLQSNNLIFRVELKGNENFVNILQIANNISFKTGDNLTPPGTVIDVDISLSGKERLASFFSDMDSVLEKIHNEEKQLFFPLLKDDYLKSLNPEY